MAKADDTTSTDWIWLGEALALAVRSFGSMAGAKEQLTQWLAAGKLPWDCMGWKALNAEEIAELRQSTQGNELVSLTPSAAYCPGAPQFWGGAAASRSIGKTIRRARM